MSDSSPKSPPKTSPCKGCGGSGQSQYFGGESRFMFTYEDCPDCHGTGIVLEEVAENVTEKELKHYDTGYKRSKKTEDPI